MKSTAIQFTRAELLELWRALDLIQQEDARANVNTEPEHVAAKDRAKLKVSRALKRTNDVSLFEFTKGVEE